MYRLLFMLALTCACAAVDRGSLSIPRPPAPYFQSNEAFTYISVYLRSRLPHKVLDFYDAKDRLAHSFGLMLPVLKELTLSRCMLGRQYDPIGSFERNVPKGWENYSYYANGTRQLVLEAFVELKPLVTIIYDQLVNSDSVDECNRKVDIIISEQPTLLGHRARLLLSLGKLSTTLAPLIPQLDLARENYNMVPYLLHNLEGKSIKHLVDDLCDSYKLLFNKK